MEYFFIVEKVIDSLLTFPHMLALFSTILDKRRPYHSLGQKINIHEGVLPH